MKSLSRVDYAPTVAAGLVRNGELAVWALLETFRVTDWLKDALFAFVEAVLTKKVRRLSLRIIRLKSHCEAAIGECHEFIALQVIKLRLRGTESCLCLVQAGDELKMSHLNIGEFLAKAAQKTHDLLLLRRVGRRAKVISYLSCDRDPVLKGTTSFADDSYCVSDCIEIDPKNIHAPSGLHDSVEPSSACEAAKGESIQ